MATFGYDMSGWGWLMAAGERAEKVVAGGMCCMVCVVKIMKSEKGWVMQKYRRNQY